MAQFCNSLPDDYLAKFVFLILIVRSLLTLLHKQFFSEVADFIGKKLLRKCLNFRLFLACKEISLTDLYVFILNLKY